MTENKTKNPRKKLEEQLEGYRKLFDLGNLEPKELQVKLYLEREEIKKPKIKNLFEKKK